MRKNYTTHAWTTSHSLALTLSIKTLAIHKNKTKALHCIFQTDFSMELNNTVGPHGFSKLHSSNHSPPCCYFFTVSIAWMSEFPADFDGLCSEPSYSLVNTATSTHPYTTRRSKWWFLLFQGASQDSSILSHFVQFHV